MKIEQEHSALMSSSYKGVDLYLLLLRKDDFYNAVEWRAMTRRIPVMIFFVRVAITLDISVAFRDAFIAWLILLLLRSPLWSAEIHHRNLWAPLVFVTGLFVRWVLIIVCIVVFWLRSNVGLGQELAWLFGMFVFDIAATFFSEGRGYRQARATIHSLEQEYHEQRMAEESVLDEAARE